MIPRRSDVSIAVFVLAIAAMLLVPLPPRLLDFLIAVNLSFSVLLLLVGLYMSGSVGLLSFPTLLLLTTLFRLGLNVASTRLILTEGYAGDIINTFGIFLIRGDVVVGGIIFTIITVVSFVVIARGAQRVSEVAARFALDALPGKQLSIEADVRSGLLTLEQGQRRRDALRQESQLYGAMDGAMKFVHGDAVAGLLIIVTNIVGGVYQGVSKGMSLDESLQVYTRLTIGDGLVSQIPSLLVAICAGVIVTRVSSGEDTTLGNDLSKQLFGNTSVLVMASVVILVLPLVTGLPMVPFFLSAVFLMMPAFLRFNLGVQDRPEYLVVESPEISGIGKGDAKVIGDRPLPALPEVSALEIRLEARQLFLIYQQQKKEYQALWLEFNREFQQISGLALPHVRVTSSERLRHGEYEVVFNGVIIQKGSVVPEAFLIEMNPLCAESFGLKVECEARHPVHGNAMFWTSLHSWQVKMLRDAGIGMFNVMTYVFHQMGQVLRDFPEDIFSLMDVQSMVREIDQRFPGFVLGAFNGQSVNLGVLTEFCQQLVREGESVADFRMIIEIFSGYFSKYAANLGNVHEVQISDIVSFYRQSRRRRIIGKWIGSAGRLRAILLSPNLEEALELARLDTQSNSLTLDLSEVESAEGALRVILHPIRTKGVVPVVVLCRAELRERVTALVRMIGERIAVLAIEELEPSNKLETVGVWSWG